MAEELEKRRSRRALLAAAAGGAAALAANAALPLTAAAATGEDMVLGTANTADATTSIENTTDGSTAFHATAAGQGFGVHSFSSGAAGVYATSVDETGAAGAELTEFTGVYGWSAASDDPSFGAAGVVGQSPDIGVFGDGTTGVFGAGDWGVYGEGATGVEGYGVVGVRGIAAVTGGYGVLALAESTDRYALRVDGKIRTNRSGRKSIASGKSSVAVSLAGVTSSSKVFAVLATSESGRWVRAVVPASGKFTVYLNTTLRSSAVVSWFVLD